MKLRSVISCCAVVFVAASCSANRSAAPSVSQGPGVVGIQMENGLYQAPNPLPYSNRGTVIASRDDGPQDRFAGAHKYTVLYHSVTTMGADVPVSGAVLVPPGEPPAEGWPVVSWAHGTTGIANRCAPSLTENFAYDAYADELAKLVRSGYAVAATDYIGLGLPGRHLYESATEEGNAIADIVVAARNLAPDISPHTWFATGHSQGGSGVVAAAWNTSSSASRPPNGVVAIAPSADFANEVRYLDSGAMSSKAAYTYYAFDMLSLSEIDSTVPTTRTFTEDGLRRVADFRNGTCLWDLLAAAKKPDVDVSNFTDYALHDVALANRLAAYGNPDRGFPLSPVLSITGAQDTDVPPGMVATLVKGLRTQGVDVSDYTVPGDHSAALKETFCVQATFMAQHGGAPVHPGSCPAGPER